MEVGAEFNKQQWHGQRYFNDLLEQVTDVPESVKDLLRTSRSAMETFQATQQQLLERLQTAPLLQQRVQRLMRRGRWRLGSRSDLLPLRMRSVTAGSPRR
jgi:transposase